MQKKKRISLIVSTALLFALTTLGVVAGQTQIALAVPAAVTCTAPPPASTTKGPYTTADIEKCDDPAVKGGNCSDITKCDLIKNYINPFVVLISALAGIGIVIGIIIGGIEYASSGGDPQKAASGKGHIKGAVIALLVFMFLWALLKFLVPSGVTG